MTSCETNINPGADTGQAISPGHIAGLNRAETASDISEVCGVFCLGTQRQSLHLQRAAAVTAAAWCRTATGGNADKMGLQRNC